MVKAGLGVRTDDSVPAYCYGRQLHIRRKQNKGIEKNTGCVAGHCGDSIAMDSGEYCFMDNDIMMASKEADTPVPFTITVKDASGAVMASGEFSFDANMEKCI